ncbi:MAG: hypothetical protein ACXVCY_19490 [Pseudobdellovibrionaceae bacterium]
MKKLLSIFLVLFVAQAKAIQIQDVALYKVDKMEQNFKDEFFREYTKVKAVKVSSSVQENSLDSTSVSFMDQVLEFSRLNILIGAFTELDLKVVDFKIQPYVEFRFDK